MVSPLIGAAAIGAGADLFGSIFGGSKTPEIPRTPYDQRPQRRNVIGLQNYLLGFSPGFTPYDRQVPGGTWGGQLGNPYQAPPASQGGPIQRPGTQPPGGYGGGAGGGTTPWGSGGGGQSPWPWMNQQQGGGGQMSGFGAGDNLGGQGSGTGGFSAMGQGMLGRDMASMFRPTPGGDPNAMMTFGGGGQQGGLASAVPFTGPWMNSQTPGSNQLPQGAANNPMLERMESYFGPLGTPTTALQQQSMNGISNFLASNPYGASNNLYGQAASGQNYNEANNAFRGVQGANYFGGAQNAFGGASGQFGKAGNAFDQVGGANYFGAAQGGFNKLGQGNYFDKAENAFQGLGNYNPFGAAQSSMEKLLATNPGMQGMDALRPLLDRNLAAANQQGGRFGSANAILRSRAVDDNNLLAAQMYQKGVDQQIGAAGQYGQMGSSLIGARGMGAQGLLGVGQGRMSQQQAAAQGMLGVGQGRLQQGLGAAQGQLGVGQGMLGVGQGMLGVGQGRLEQGLGAAQGLGGLAQALSGNQLAAAGGMANNQNMFMGNQVAGYGVGQQQAQQEAERQQQALAILMQQLGVAEQGSLMGRG